MKLNITEKDYGILISNSDQFLTISDFTISNICDVVDKICILKPDAEFSENCSYIAQTTNSLNYFTNTYDDLEIITFMENDVVVGDFTDKLKVANSPKGFIDAKVNLSHVIYIDKNISKKNLFEIYKLVSNVKAKFLSNLSLPLHIQNILNNNDFLAVLVNNSSLNDDVDFEDLKLRLQDAVEISLEDAFEKLDLTFGILDYLVSEGILIGDLIDAGMELLSDVEVTDELKNKMEVEILKSLSDINVITLLMSAIRLNQDLTSNNIFEVNDGYLYSDKVLGLAVANQIGATEASFNFKKYFEEKPGIIYGLPLILDCAFAGLIAGCVTKILEQ